MSNGSGAAPATQADPAVAAKLQRLLDESAYINVLSVTNPERPPQGVPTPGSRDPQQIIGFRPYEQPHRFAITVESRDGVLRASNRVGAISTELTMRWLAMPDDFFARPDTVPPATPLDFDRAQRFVALDGTFVLDDEGKNGFTFFGDGQTYAEPAVAGERRMRLGAVGNLSEGFGIFKDRIATLVVNGVMLAPDQLLLQLLIRIPDPDGIFRASSDLEPVKNEGDPARNDTFFTLLGQPAGPDAVEQHFAADGRMVGASVAENLRLVALDWDTGADGKGLRTSQRIGPLVGRLNTDIIFEPMNPDTPGTAISPVPFTTQNTTIDFFDSAGNTTGTMHPNLTEGRGFMMQLPGTTGVQFRIVAFGPVDGGSGQFDGAFGMLAVNSQISPLPPALSNLYVLRLADPTHRYRIGG